MTSHDVSDSVAPSWVKRLTPQERTTLQASAKRCGFTSRETVFSPALRPNTVYLLERGLVRVYRLSDNGSETTLGYIAPGEIFGELTVFGNYPRESFAQALKPSIVWKLPRERVRALFDSRPLLIVELTQQVVERFKQMESRAERQVTHNVRARVALALLDLSKRFGHLEADGSVELILNITQTELASLIGSTRQTVNTSLRELRRAGLVHKRGPHLVLLKPGELNHA